MSGALFKVEGAGNDFVLGLGSWADRLGEDPVIVRRLCDRRRGVGADGALALWPSGSASVRLVYRNADGGEARFCANGTRCAAAAARRWLGAPAALRVGTAWGEIPAEVEGDVVELRLPPVTPPRELKLELEGRGVRGWLVEVGVPHLVVPVADVDDVDLAREGPRLRRLPLPGPDGSNVHVVARAPDGLRIRSWERGVESETWCCGSGVVAAALLELEHTGSSRVEVRPRSGDLLGVATDGRPFAVPVRASGPVRWIARLEVEPRWLATAG